MHFFAHEGHTHPEVVEQGPDIMTAIFINAAPFIVLGCLLVLLHYVFRIKPAPLFIVSLGFLLVTGLTLYQWAPVASIVALVAGFGLALALLIIPHKAKR